MKAIYICPNVNLRIMGVDFLAQLIVLESKDLDIILGMNWLAGHDATIQCAKRTVLLTGPNGDKVELVADPPSGSGGSVQQLDGKSLEDIRVFVSIHMCFQRSYQVCHPTVMLSLLLIYCLVLLLFLNVHIECLVLNC
jgi:hypothetical protein